MKVDMSKAAITMRLEEFRQIWRLCMTLKNSRIVKLAAETTPTKKAANNIGSLAK